MTFSVSKINGKLIFNDFGGYEMRNPSTFWCIQKADEKYNWKDFNEIIIHTGDYDNNNNDYTYSKKDNYNNLVPDFNFHSWPQVGINDYEKLVEEIDTAGLNNYEINKVGWIGNKETNIMRKKLLEIGDQNKELFDIFDMNWINSGNTFLNSSKYISTPELVKKYSILIDIEGNGYSGRVKHLLWSHRPLLLVDRPHKEFFFEFLKEFSGASLYIAPRTTPLRLPQAGTRQVSSGGSIGRPRTLQTATVTPSRSAPSRTSLSLPCCTSRRQSRPTHSFARSRTSTCGCDTSHPGRYYGASVETLTRLGLCKVDQMTSCPPPFDALSWLAATSLSCLCRLTPLSSTGPNPTWVVSTPSPSLTRSWPTLTCNGLGATCCAARSSRATYSPLQLTVSGFQDMRPLPVTASTFLECSGAPGSLPGLWASLERPRRGGRR